ncbi:Crp/Fnr family transcriptional regulator [Chitinophaga qingshengii]|uniref:Crp/Fnr family transcriptional regulator n=1 Tax=Chitinophaga qingshengii TaxID=1569794 RepID=A0ABR7TNS1_9BACT|nr:Crp/Fnr family transcriptional regulator [Chitinophaga qingshengii]MBC9931213.1 Crp/Fnr family transcriptional regulator [Chitinophaga qingshengii]
MQQLIAYIHSLTTFSDDNWQHLLPALSVQYFHKDDYLLKAGEVCNALYFICRGYCRAYYDKDGVDINTDFFFEQDIATNINSYGRREKSAFAIQACESLEVVRFDRELLLSAAARDPQIETLGRLCLQRIAARQEKHTALFKLMSAQERYEYLEQTYPEMLQRVSLSQLSSFLGVARETLSRIRSRRQS